MRISRLFIQLCRWSAGARLCACSLLCPPPPPQSPSSSFINSWRVAIASRRVRLSVCRTAACQTPQPTVCHDGGRASVPGLLCVIINCSLSYVAENKLVVVVCGMFRRELNPLVPDYFTITVKVGVPFLGTLGMNGLKHFYRAMH